MPRSAESADQHLIYIGGAWARGKIRQRACVSVETFVDAGAHFVAVDVNSDVIFDSQTEIC